ncbi:transporter, dicarboxylate/amino acid:cation Na+/H+ symporter family protein [Sphingobacterium spiritivorum ATCC 33300]|uniref:Transporter, dicarboxylate/amino acid:cation Na+/H+ symporter family protein n=1 Tax=Sphingobacterium spiritivorum ATCC 33300 TaxID=525372 RepID=C2G3T0_SPHSI|nr:cation:dicarboxylase symporter family transporter [Sphingobacterium spiritivorum]EEI90285.1 transporter, dicarboxylate/amino acid:cation Na+/H+ symporter family protein [Sphingobacterium spiritivorum ATCC 33300]QQS95091.1 cation:dicarboxylase symporter family transporter [Sphingobacterium spiritivorum]
MFKSKMGLLTFAVLSIATILTVLYEFNWVSISPDVMMVVRWVVGVVLVINAFQRKNLTSWILTCMILGIFVGIDFPNFAIALQPLSKGFIKLVKTIVGPILFATLVYGIAGHSDLKQVGRMAWKSMLYFFCATTCAIFIGLAAINITHAGVGIDIQHMPHEELPVKKENPDQNSLNHLPESVHGVYKFTAFFRDLFPENIVKSVYENQVLQIVVFSVLFGIGLALVEEKKRKPLVNFTESLSEAMFKFTNIIMYFAPVGVGAAMAYTVGHLGVDILKNLFMLLATLYMALIFFLLLVLLPVALYLKIPVLKFINAIKEPVSIAFATTSSDAALPKAMSAMERFGVPRRIVSFVIPTGYSFNLDGTSLYLSLAAIFVAQAAGMHLSFGQQLMIAFTLMITSKGVAAVPRASLIILIATADQFGLPVFVIAAILGIDELMDMARTSVNVIGNCLATVVVAKWEGEFDEDAPYRTDDPDAL